MSEEAVWTVPGAVAFDAEGRPKLIGGRCANCGVVVFPKAKVCRACWSEQIVDHALASDGVLYSYAVVHVARKGWKTPYTIGYVDLDDGTRVSSLIACDPKSPPAPDTRVRLVAGEIGRTDDGSPIMSHQFAA